MEKMEREEMIEMLKVKANVSAEEAEEVLEKMNWDLLDSIIYLERRGKVENTETTTIINLEKEDDYEKKNDTSDGAAKSFGRFFKFVGKIIKKGNKNYFTMKKDKEEPIKISLTVSVILLLLAFWLVGGLLVLGLFLGYRYSIEGPNINNNKVNDILKKASESAENIKSDFQEGYKG